MTEASPHVRYCPFCGCASALHFLDVPWKIQSLDPVDPDNVGEAQEYQCEACDGRSFWA